MANPVTAFKPDNSRSEEQLQQWLSDTDVAELSSEEKDAIGQLLIEFQALPPASISPQLEGRLQVLSQLQPTPNNPLKRLVTILAASLAATAAALTWQFSGLELRVAQKETAPAPAQLTVPGTPENRLAVSTSPYKEFLLTSSRRTGAQATVMIRPDKATNLLVAKGLPQLPSGQIYRLWAETPLGPQGCMTFQPDVEGNAHIQVPSEPSGSAISLLVSIDPIQAGSAAEKPANPVLMSI